MKIKLHDSKDGQVYFTTNARNGKVITTSETYKSKQGMMNAVNLFPESWPIIDANGVVIRERELS